MMGWQKNDKMALKWHKWHGMNEMTSEWQYIVNMNYDWWNDTWMAERHLSEGMTIKWQDDIQMVDRMVEWHSNDGMTNEWGF